MYVVIYGLLFLTLLSVPIVLTGLLEEKLMSI